MDKFMLFSTFHSFVESSLLSFIDTLLAKTQAASVHSYHEPIPPLPLFDATPPLVYPYAKTPSAYSTVIQLYARSGQLDSKYLLSCRLKDGHQPWCRFSCQHIEDAHHIFVQCPKFIMLRESYSTCLHDATYTILSTYHLPLQDLAFITE